MGRLLALLGGVAWLGVLVLAALTIRWSDEPRPVSRLSTLPPLLTQLNAARPSGSGEGESWIVTKATSAHDVLVVQVRAADPGEARAISTYLVETVSDRHYDEILIYFWSFKGRQFADRRIQWTPRGGYTEMVMGD